MAFLGLITQTPFSAVVLPGDFTSASYSNGILTVLDHHRTVAALHITAFDDMGFDVAHLGDHTVISTPGPAGALVPPEPGALVAIPPVPDPWLDFPRGWSAVRITADVFRQSRCDRPARLLWCVPQLAST
jgi:hypothetical protein